MTKIGTNRSWTWNGTRNVLNLERYVPSLINAIATALSRGPSRRYLQRFGLGIIEWRVVAAIAAASDEVTASRICQMIGLDKAAASRSLRILEKLELVSGAEDPKDQRTRRFNLTSSGYRFHDKVFPIAVERERVMLQRLSGNDIFVLIDLLHRVREQMPSVKAYNPLKTSLSSKQKPKLRSARKKSCAR